MAVDISRPARGSSPLAGEGVTELQRGGALGGGPAVVVIQPYPTPHRDDLFDEVNRLAPGAVALWFLSGGSKGRPWLPNPPQCPYPATFISGDLIERRDWRRGAKQVYARLRKAKPRAIICGYEHAEYWAAYLWGKLNASRTLCWMGTTGYEPRPILRRAIRNSLLRSLDGLILYSSLTEEFVRTAGLDNLPRHVLPNASDTRRFRSTPELWASRRTRIRKELQLEQGDFVVLYAGRLSQEKNLGTLVEGIAMSLRADGSYDGIRLLVIGSGPSEGSLREKVNRLGLQSFVRWRGGVLPEDLPAYFAAADMFALVSLHETWGMVVNEAAAAGLPTVVSPRCGAAHHLFPGPLAALVVLPDEPEALASVILRLARDESFRLRMGQLLKDSEHRFSVGAMARQMLSILDLAPSNGSDPVTFPSSKKQADVS